MLTLDDLDLFGKKVLMRVDFNVPLDEKGNISDDSRIQACLPTIWKVLEKGGALILMSHLGRPKGKKAPGLSLDVCSKKLSELLHLPVQFALDCVGEEAKQKTSSLKPKEILLLENVRFHKGEEHPEEEPEFVENLASLGDVYINDAFGASHRKHASTTLIANYFKGRKAPGLLLEKEIFFLDKALKNPEHPFIAIIGGAKISSKIGILKSLIEKVDGVLIGGAMAFTFLKALGKSVGDSLVEESSIEEAKEILAAFQKEQVPFLLPVDAVITNSFSDFVVSLEDGIPSGYKGVDVGPKTLQLFFHTLDSAKTVFWNGPLGVFENPLFSKGTFAMAEKLGTLKATTIVGGGDSAAAIRQAGFFDKITHVSTGGGATLEYLEKKTLPGIQALKEEKT